MNRFHPRSAYNALKAATRRLTEMAGGLEPASCVTRVRKSQLGDYGNPHTTESFMPVDVLLDIEASLGEPVLTRELARLQGHVLIAIPQANASDDVFYRHLGEMGKECGEAIAKVSEALLNGGTIYDWEIEKLNLRGEIREAIEALTRMDHALAQVQTNGKKAPKRGQGKGGGT